MKLVLQRNQPNGKATIGSLTVDGAFECYTLEDPNGANDRIPAGVYRVVIDFSERFQKLMPHIIGSSAVDERGIRIHSGNTGADTTGCVLVGKTMTDSTVGESRDAFNALYAKISATIQRGEVVALLVLDASQPGAPNKDAQLRNLPTVAGTSQTAAPAPASRLGNGLSRFLGMFQALLSFLLRA